MQNDTENTAELRSRFWKEMAESPHVMLQIDGDPESAAPMRAQLDKEADAAIWFFAHRSGHFGNGGPATATFAAKGHGLFARFHGLLSEETSPECIDRHWSNWVEAWFPNGKDDPDLIVLRMDLGDAAIWDSELGLLTTAKMALGMNVREDAKGSRVNTML